MSVLFFSRSSDSPKTCTLKLIGDWRCACESVCPEMDGLVTCPMCAGDKHKQIAATSSGTKQVR